MKLIPHNRCPNFLKQKLVSIIVKISARISNKVHLPTTQINSLTLFQATADYTDDHVNKHNMPETYSY